MGDVITKFGGKDVASIDDLVEGLTGSPNPVVLLTVVRNGQLVEFHVAAGG